jgi:hypothetical protein
MYWRKLLDTDHAQKTHVTCSLIFFLICIVGGGVQTGSTRHVDHLLAYCTCPGWLWGCRIWWNEWQGKPKYSEKTWPGATLSTTNPTWPDSGLNPGRRGRKPATNRFSYGAASRVHYLAGPLARWLLPTGNTRHVTATHCCGDVIAPAWKCVYGALAYKRVA